MKMYLHLVDISVPRFAHTMIIQMIALLRMITDLHHQIIVTDEKSLEASRQRIGLFDKMARKRIDHRHRESSSTRPRANVAITMSLPMVVLEATLLHRRVRHPKI